MAALASGLHIVGAISAFAAFAAETAADIFNGSRRGRGRQLPDDRNTCA